MNPEIHSKNSVKKYGGKPEDYLEIHQAMDSAKVHLGTIIHRLILHNTFGIDLVEKQFGEIVQVGPPGRERYVKQNFIINSDGTKVYIKDVLQDHVREDMFGQIPTLPEQFKDVTVELVASKLGIFGPLMRNLKQKLG